MQTYLHDVIYTPMYIYTDNLKNTFIPGTLVISKKRMEWHLKKIKIKKARVIDFRRIENINDKMIK